MKTSRRMAVGLLLALPAACRSPNPNLYTLAQVPGEERRGAPKLISLRSPSLPHYLERSEIVRSSENYQLDVLQNDWWGESLTSMLTRVLADDLNQRLPGSTVFKEVGAVTATPDAEVAVNITRFDMNRSGQLLLEALVSVSGKRAGTQQMRLTVPVRGPGTPELVAAMSTALGQLADGIASMLATGQGAARAH